MAKTLALTGHNQYSDIKKRILFLLGALFVYRIGVHVPVPGIDSSSWSTLFGSDKTGILSMFNMFSGGALSKATVFAIGIMPYISASIIMQLASEMMPSLKYLKKEGESGRRKITQYTRYATVLLASVQSYFIAAKLLSYPSLVIIPQLEFYVTTIISLVAGTVFLMWLGEQMTERGIGNGISLIICAGIVSGIIPAINNAIGAETSGNSVSQNMHFILLICAVVAIAYLVVFVEAGQRKVLVTYAKRQVGGRVLQSQNTHISLKLNMSGVIPPIFASSLILFSGAAIHWIVGRNNSDFEWLRWFAGKISPGEPLYILLYASAIIFFCYFYTALVYSPKEIADNLKKSGAFIPGIRPGELTSLHIEKILLRLTLIGAIYIVLVCLSPSLASSIGGWHMSSYFGGTSLLIIVVVAMDFKVQVQSYLFSQQYSGFLLKNGSANAKNRR